MAVTQTSNIVIQILTSLTNGLDLGSAIDKLALDWTFAIGNGAGDGSAEQIFHDQRTLAASATEDLDLAGVLTNAFGATLTFTKIKAMFFKAASANTNNVQVTRPASNGLPFMLAAGDGLAIKPGGVFMLIDPSAAGYAVTGGTGDLVTVTNSAGSTSVTYDVVILGAIS